VSLAPPKKNLEIIEHIQRWVDRIVIGENLCPFARPSIDRGQFEIKVSEATNIEEAYRDALTHIEYFCEPSNVHLDSLLLVFSTTLHEFEVYLDCLSACEYALETLELEGIIQLASFHPDYLFDGTDVTDHAHWTNRAPFPAIHLLRESSVSEALNSVTHPDKIPQRNIEHLRKLSPTELKHLFDDL